MVSTFCAARLPIQICYPQELQTQVSYLIAPFTSRKKSRLRFSLNLNGVRYEFGDYATAQAQKRVFKIINVDRKSSTVEIGTRAIQAVSAAISLFLVVALAEKHGLLLHGAHVERNGLAYIFLGRSGAGKSTIAHNASGVEIVHDDRLAVRKMKDRWWVFGLPVCDNANNTGKNIEAPLAGVYIIHKSNKLSADQLSSKSSLLRVAANMILPIQKGRIAKNSLQTLMHLVSENKCFWLQFEKDSDVMDII